MISAPGHDTEARNRRISELGLLGVAVAFGLTFTLVQDAIRDLPPWSFVAFRFLLASGILLLPYGRQVRRLPAAGWGAGLVLGLLLIGGYSSRPSGSCTRPLPTPVSSRGCTWCSHRFSPG